MDGEGAVAAAAAAFSFRFAQCCLCSLWTFTAMVVNESVSCLICLSKRLTMTLNSTSIYDISPSSCPIRCIFLLLLSISFRSNYVELNAASTPNIAIESEKNSMVKNRLDGIHNGAPPPFSPSVSRLFHVKTDIIAKKFFPIRLCSSFSASFFSLSQQHLFHLFLLLNGNIIFHLSRSIWEHLKWGKERWKIKS